MRYERREVHPHAGRIASEVLRWCAALWTLHAFMWITVSNFRNVAIPANYWLAPDAAAALRKWIVVLICLEVLALGTHWLTGPPPNQFAKRTEWWLGLTLSTPIFGCFAFIDTETTLQVGSILRLLAQLPH